MNKQKVFETAFAVVLAGTVLVALPGFTAFCLLCWVADKLDVK